MIFKSRVQRDVQDFKSLQDAAARRAQERSKDPGAPAVSKPDEPQMEKLDDAMIDKMIREVQAQGTAEAGEAPSIVSGDATWDGKIRVEGNIRIAGRLSGEIEAGKTVFVVAGSRVRADVRARKVVVGGDLEGHITCREQLVVEGSGRLSGKVDTASLVIEEGAAVQSQIHMLRASQPSGNHS